MYFDESAMPGAFRRNARTAVFHKDHEYTLIKRFEAKASWGGAGVTIRRIPDSATRLLTTSLRESDRCRKKMKEGRELFLFSSLVFTPPLSQDDSAVSRDQAISPPGKRFVFLFCGLKQPSRTESTLVNVLRDFLCAAQVLAL